jgi:hypothetical protein
MGDRNGSLGASTGKLQGRSRTIVTALQRGPKREKKRLDHQSRGVCKILGGV